jgi:hypothetical protein
LSFFDRSKRPAFGCSVAASCGHECVICGPPSQYEIENFNDSANSVPECSSRSVCYLLPAGESDASGANGSVGCAGR